MTEKLEFYDVLGILVPGTLTICVGAFCFPSVPPHFSSVQFPEAFAVLALTALAFFLGQFIQAVSSMIEPWLERTWGGRLSEEALGSGLGTRYFPSDSAKRIRDKLTKTVGEKASGRSLFLRALQLAESSSNSRVARFNALYAYHRALLVLVLVSVLFFGASLRWGVGSNWQWQERSAVFMALVALLLLGWYRTKQRAIYYVREVLFTAERLIDDKKQKT